MFKRITFLFCSIALVAVSSPLTVQAAPSAQKDWTFLIYLNGDNSLDSFGSFNIKQMEKVGSTDKVNVIVQWASLEKKKTVRLLVKKSSDPQNVTSPVIQDMGVVDMGDYHSLVDFIQWGAANYPAKHYFVDVWDHGSGWHAITLKQKEAGFHPTDISWDDSSGNFITTKQLGMALAEGARAIGHKIDVYGSDACLMAMAEVAGEMKDSVSMFVGSEELEPGAGWPYDMMLNDWNTRASASPADVAKLTTENYTKSYLGGENGNQEVTFAAYDLSKLDRFQNSLRSLGASLMKLDAPNRAKVVSSFRSAQGFYYDDYRDLGDFIEVLDKAQVDSLDRSSVADVRAALSAFVIANADTANYAKAKGVSMWMPNNMNTYKSYSDAYKALQFNDGTQWADALAYVLQDAATQPPNRR